jgi:diguanylate cyclase (GGDEF)-like protein
MPETNLDDAALVAERLRRCVAGVQVREQEALIELRASVGVAARSQEMESLEQLIYLADQCLYTAKSQGRNQVVLSMA